MTWIETHPNATRLQRVEAMADALVGASGNPTEFTLAWYGLEPDFDITNESEEITSAYDAIVTRCTVCDWHVDADEVDAEGRCEDCQNG
jgi:hypothetical protein